MAKKSTKDSATPLTDVPSILKSISEPSMKILSGIMLKKKIMCH